MCSPRERKLAAKQLIEYRQGAREHWEASFNVVRDVKDQYNTVKAARPPRPNTPLGLVKFWPAWLFRMFIAQAKIVGAQQQHYFALNAYMSAITETKQQLNGLLSCGCHKNIGLN